MSESNSSHTLLGAGAEFDLIREMIAEWGEVARGIGDDAAILAVPPGQQLVVSTDATVEDVHFRRRWLSPREAGARAATAALSDLAAVGATAQSVLVSLVVPTVWREHVKEFAAGIGASTIVANAKIVGGNVSRGATFSCTLTVIGYAERPVYRSTARVGDDVFITGTLGGPRAALEAWERQENPPEWARERFLHPVARLAEGRWLASQGATAMMDISDGLAADARHLAAASGVHCALEPGLVPRFPDVSAEYALGSGEEYELLVTLAHAESDRIAAQFQAHFGYELSRIGVVEPPVAVTFRPDDALRVEIPDGHDHFSKR